MSKTSFNIKFPLITKIEKINGDSGPYFFFKSQSTNNTEHWVSLPLEKDKEPAEKINSVEREVIDRFNLKVLLLTKEYEGHKFIGASYARFVKSLKHKYEYVSCVLHELKQTKKLLNCVQYHIKERENEIVELIDELDSFVLLFKMSAK